MSKGHNSQQFYGGLSAEHLKQYVERLERLEEEKKNISEDIKEVFGEAKGNGFDVKTLKEILKIRKVSDSDLEEQEYLLDTYKMALGMVPQTEMFDKDDNPAKTSSTTITIKTANGSVETTLDDMKKAAADLIANPEKVLDLKSKAIQAVQNIKACGDKIREVGRNHGSSEATMLKLMADKAKEVQEKVGLPADDVLAIMVSELEKPEVDKKS